MQLKKRLLATQRLSQRRCCALAGLSKEAKRSIENEVLLKRILELANKHNRFGYRRVHGYLTRQEGLWKQEGLQVKKRKRRKKKKEETLILIPQQAKSPNHVWTVDFVYDTLASGRGIRLLSVIDEFTRE
jgi:putative transposase